MTLSCAQCGQQFERRRPTGGLRTFCSQRCSAIFNNRRRATGRGSKRPLLYCESCGVVLSYRNRRYCTIACQVAEKWRRRREEIAAGLGFGRFSIRPLKRYLLETRGHRCEICRGETWLDRPIPLELDHVDGRSDDNLPENLRLICPNCHALTPTYKAKNRGNGRHFRRERYRANQSY